METEHYITCSAKTASELVSHLTRNDSMANTATYAVQIRVIPHGKASSLSMSEIRELFK